MKRIIKKILREQFEYKEQLFDLIRTADKDNIEIVKIISKGQDINFIELLIDYFKENPKPPYFKILEHFDLSEEEFIYVLSEIFGEPVRKKGIFIYNQNGNKIYYENYHGTWGKIEYDENGNIIYVKDSFGYWRRFEYDDNGNEIYYENSNGDWEKYEYDDNENMIYSENSNGFWSKREYDNNGRLIYSENSDGEIYDRR